jgi:uncharacterized protein YndB with AHSA1/START domain
MTTELRIERGFEAPREQVFDAWVNPTVLSRWWAPGEDWDTPIVEVDLRVGGRYRLATRNVQTGEIHTVGGEYKEIERPERLSYSWAWENERDRSTSTVTVEFRERGGGTTVLLTHTGLPSDESHRVHSHGWASVMDTLERRMLAAADRA